MSLLHAFSGQQLGVVNDLYRHMNWPHATSSSGVAVSTTGGPFSDGYFQCGSNAVGVGAKLITTSDCSAVVFHHAFWYRKSSATTAETLLAQYVTAGGQGFQVRRNANDTLTIRQWRSDASAGATVVTSTSTVSNSAWNLIEIAFLGKDVGGIARIRFNGNIDAEFSGDTVSSGDPSAGGLYRFYLDGTGSGSHQYAHSLVWDEAGAEANWSTVGSGLRARRATINGAGTSTQFTPSAGSNWQNVDEAPGPTLTDFNSSTTAGHIDSFAHGGFPTPTTTYQFVGVGLLARNDGQGAPDTVRAKIRSNGAYYSGASVTVAPTTDPVEGFWFSDPDDSGAWTEARVDALEPGYELVT